MNKFFALSIISFGILISCNSDKKQRRVESNVAIPHPMNITSYTGNAVAFFSEDNFRCITFIPVLEKDSSKFKKSDIFQSVKGRCSINMFIGDYLTKKLINSKEKKELKRDICDIWYATYYIKIWISYKDYEESLYKRRNKTMIDSCNCRDIASSKPSSELLEFKILGN